MTVPLKGLLLTTFPILLLSAQETYSVAVENIQLDKEKEIVAFDVENLSARAIHAWTATITVTKRKANVPDLQTIVPWRSDRCSPAKTGQSPPKDSLHCALSVAFGDLESRPISAEAKVTAILFEDGTTEGDVQFLDQASAFRHAIFLTNEYWLTSFRHTRSTGSPVEQLETFRKLLGAPDSATLSGLALTVDVYPYWQSMSQLVADALRRAGNGSAAEAEAAAVEKMLEDRERASKRASEVFPSRGNPSSEDSPAAQPENPVESRLLGLKILKTERHSGALAAYVRNDYPAEIAGYAIGSGDGSRNLSSMSGGAAIAPGETFQIDLPTPRSPGAPAPEILCVVFQNRTGDGDPVKIQELNEHWAGRLSARAVFSAELGATAALPESEIPAGIEKLADELQNDPHDMPDGYRSLQFAEGVQFERSWVRSLILQDLRQLRTLPNGGARLKQAMIALVEKLERQ